MNIFDFYKLLPIMKRNSGQQRSLSFLDPNLPVEPRNVTVKSLGSHNKENQAKRLKQADNSQEVKTTTVTAKRYHTVSRQSAILILDDFAISSTYCEDILRAELNLCSRMRLPMNFCNNPAYVVTPFHREVALEWLIDLQLFLKTGNDAFHLAVALTDTVLDSQRIDEDEVQAVAAAAMWLAHKFLYGGIRANLILRLCKKVSVKQLVASERRVFQAAKMNLIFSNPTTLLNHHLHSLLGDEVPLVEYHMSNYFFEIMLLIVNFSTEELFKRAAVAVETALQLLRTETQGELVFIRGSGLLIYKRLLSTLRSIWNCSSFKEKSSLFFKYSAENRQRVSLHPCLNPDFLKN